MTYFLSFFIFSFFGWVLEIIFAFLRTKEIQNRKTMKFLPLCPVYGIAATMLLFISKLIPKNIILYFIIGVLICSFVEYFFNEFFKISRYDDKKIDEHDRYEKEEEKKFRKIQK